MYLPTHDGADERRTILLPTLNNCKAKMTAIDKTTDNTINDYNRYKVGVSADSYLPSEREVRIMLRIVAYDIANPKRLRLVARACEDYGVRVEKSVFECDLNEADFAALWKRLNGLVDPEEDAVIVYRICLGCVRDTQSIGLIARPGPVLVYLP